MHKKKHLRAWLAAGVLAAAPLAHANTLFSESFDSFAALAGAGWVLTNASASPLGTSWFEGNPGVFAAQSGAANSYAAANFLSTGATTGAISNWLITPLIDVSVGGGDVLSFAVRGEGVPGFTDSLVVKLSATGSADVGAFGTTLVLIASAQDSWITYSVPLPALGIGGGTTDVRIGFEYAVASALDANYIGLDSVSVTPIPEPGTALLLGLGAAGLFLRRRLAV
jgi:hypothetical protein